MARLRSLWLAALVLLCLAPGLAWAGTLQVRDGAAILSTHDRQQIEAAASRYPFDVRVVTSSAASDKASFARYVRAQVNEADEVVVGLDPTHRFTEVNFGTGSHVAMSERPAIERAGNAAFRDSRWGDGVVAILDQASAATRGGSTTSSGSSVGGFALGGGLFLLFIIAVPVLIIVAIVAFVGRARRAIGPGYGGPGYGGPGYGGPGYGGPGYGGPGYPPQGGGGIGPVGGGLIGAGLGGLAGYELGKMEGERERRDEGYGGGGSSYESTTGNDGGSYDDGGGGGSNWDDGGGGGGDSGGGGGSDW